MFLHHQGDSQRLICQKLGMSCHGVQCFEETEQAEDKRRSSRSRWSSRWTGSESNLLQKQETVLLCFTDGCSYLHLSSKPRGVVDSILVIPSTKTDGNMNTEKHCQSLIHQALTSGQLCDLKCPNRQQQTLSAVFDTTAPSAAKKVSSGRKLETKCRFTSVIHGAFHFFQWLHVQFFLLIHLFVYC